VTTQQNNPTSQTNETERPGRAASIVVIAAFVVILGLVVGIPYYQVFMAPWRQTILQVGETSFNMRYFIKRLRLQLTAQSKNQLEVATRILQDLQNQELYRQEAKKRNISVSDEELDSEVKRRILASATGEGEFEELYASMLRGLRLDEEEYRELVMYDLFRVKLLQDFVNQIPEATEHVHIYAIVTGTTKKAEEVRSKLSRGEDFSKVAKEESIDLASAKQGGDLGWMPKGVDGLSATGQIHAMGILTKTEKETEKLKEKILAGDDFSKTARLNSLDDASRETGGYLGWVSTDYRTGKQFAAEAYNLKPGVYSEPIDTYEGFWLIKLIEKSQEGKVIDDIAFKLQIGQVTPPLLTVKGYYLLKVAAKDSSRPLTKQHRITLANKAFDQWLAEASKQGSEKGTIKWNWGSETFGWAMAHLE
jgi:parvulin-like peptidyl-prolyl isomerase